MKRNDYCIFLGMFVICVVNMLFMHINVLQYSQVEEVLDGVSWIDNCCRIFIDLFVILLVAVILMQGRLKSSMALVFLISSMWSFSNVFYSRFFFHYITLSSIAEAGALSDPIVFKSMVKGFRFVDVYYVLSATIFILLYRICPSHTLKPFKFVKRLVWVFALIYVFNLSAHVIYCASHDDLRYFEYFRRRVARRVFGINHFPALPIYAHFHNGSVKSILVEAYMSAQGDIELTEEQKIIIRNTIDDSKASLTGCARNDKVKNLIFILIESQMSFVIDKAIDGKEVTPFLNSLKADSSVYYNGNVHPNITLGESADGQFLYMTGILPLRSMITVSKACKISLPGLPRQLKKIGITHSRMILPTSPSLWRQDEMCSRYGFEQLYSSNDYPGSHLQTLTDKQIFELASQIDLRESESPFFSIILTASMHQPYDKILDPSFEIKATSINDELKCYYNACHYTDKTIANYIHSLKDNGLYDNSMIVIASDHHVHTTDFGGGIPKDIPFFIINCDIPDKMYKGPCNQVDLYTTLIDLLNIPNAWPGLGYSLADNRYNSLELKERWDVSELIMFSDYFKYNDVFL